MLSEFLRRWTKKDEWRDELLAFMLDGDIRIDPDVHQEFAMLDSKKYDWLLRMQQPTPRYEWISESDYPTKSGHSYCVAREPEPIDAMPEFINWTAEVIVLAASQGDTKAQQEAELVNALTRLIAGTLVGLLIIGVFLVVPFMRVPAATG